MNHSHWKKGLLALVMAATIAGCTTPRTGKSSQAPARKMYFPTDNAMDALVSIEKNAPTNILAGQEFEYTIKIQNLSDDMLANVTLKEHLSGNFKLLDSSPKHSVSADGKFALWNFKQMAGKKTTVIRIRGKAIGSESFKCCATITYERYLCHFFNVSKPELDLKKYARSTAIVNEIIPVRIVVSNPGSGIAKNVVITDPLPEGMIAENGMKVLKYNIGDLASEQSKEMRFNVKATRTGKFNNVATATAGGLSATANAITVVNMPKLKIVKSATGKQYSGRNITYTIKVSNVGDANAENTVITDPLSADVSLVSASQGGMLRGKQIVWELGTLAPNTSKTVTATVKAIGLGTIRNTAFVSADHIAKIADSADTKIFGVSAILLEVTDVGDPIEVGKTGAYIVTVANQGTANDTNVKISVELEDAMSYVSSSGPTAAAVRGKKVTFAPLSVLKAKSKVSWKVIVKAESPNDVRCEVRLDSDNLSRSVMETEATTIY